MYEKRLAGITEPRAWFKYKRIAFVGVVIFYIDDTVLLFFGLNRKKKNEQKSCRSYYRTRRKKKHDRNDVGYPVYLMTILLSRTVSCVRNSSVRHRSFFDVSRVRSRGAIVCPRQQCRRCDFRCAPIRIISKKKKINYARNECSNFFKGFFFRLFRATKKPF